MSTRTVSAAETVRPVATRSLLIAAWVVATLEGYDLAVYGVSVPAIVSNPELHINRVQAGAVGSLVGIGMLVGAAVAGSVVHRVGARRLLLLSTAVFTLGMAICAAALNVELFGAGRLIVGLGLGVVLPTLTAYVADLSVPSRRSRHVTVMMTGYAVGALASPVLGAALLPQTSFRWLYLIGVVPALAAVPLLLRLPESPFHLRRTGRAAEATEVTSRFGLVDVACVDEPGEKRLSTLRSPLGPGLLMPTLLFWAMSFCGLLLVFGISAWLPTIMQTAGFSLGSALLQTAAMWLGVGVGIIVGGQVADRIGPQRVVVTAFLTGSVSLGLLSLRPSTVLVFVLMFIAGFGFIGSQIIGNAFIVTRYPDRLRSNGMGWALAVGRVGAIVGPSLGAAVLASHAAVAWNFYTFALFGVLGAVAAALVPKARSAAR